MTMPSTTAGLKMVHSLKDKKYRDRTGLFVVEGEKMVDEALKSRFEVVEVFRESDIGADNMKRISQLSTPSPVLAVVRKPEDSESSSFNLSGQGLYLALDSLRDPGNMGTIIRIADWYGIDAVFASPDSVDIFNSKVVQSTMGAIFRVPFHYCDLHTLFTREKTTLFGTFLSGDDIYNTSLEAEGSRTVLIGNESNGISDSLAHLCDRRINIPSFAKGAGSESLNAAVATAITLSEFRRR